MVEKVATVPILPSPRMLAVEIVVVALLPMAALYLTQVPLTELAKRPFGELMGPGAGEWPGIACSRIRLDPWS